jgi:hypothetical protein
MAKRTKFVQILGVSADWPRRTEMYGEVKRKRTTTKLNKLGYVFPGL